MIKIKYGNLKLGNDTIIFNMGPALTCPSKRLNLCPIYNSSLLVKAKCYAEKAEILYKDKCINFRTEQEKYWKEHTALEIITDIDSKISRRTKPVRYFRFNESGDFWNQEDIEKLSTIAFYLKEARNIVTYGYTARSDLDYTDISFLVKGSGFTKPGVNGQTTVIDHGDSIPEGYIKCPGGASACSRCQICKINVPHNVCFEKH